MNVICLVEGKCNGLSPVDWVGGHYVSLGVAFFGLVLVVARVIHSNILFSVVAVDVESGRNDVADCDVAGHGFDVVDCVVEAVSVVDSMQVSGLDLV